MDYSMGSAKMIALSPDTHTQPFTTTGASVSVSGHDGHIDDAERAIFEADKRAVYKHPLFPLLALLFERCEQATQSSEIQSSEAFNMDVHAFIQHQERDRKPFLLNEPEIDGLMIKAIQVLRIHLLELEKVQELCKDFCHRYITCLKTKMQSENLLRTEYGPGSTSMLSLGVGNSMFLDSSGSNGGIGSILMQAGSESGSNSSSPIQQYHANHVPPPKITDNTLLHQQTSDLITANTVPPLPPTTLTPTATQYLNGNDFTTSTQQLILNNYAHSLPVSPNATSADDCDDNSNSGAVGPAEFNNSPYLNSSGASDLNAAVAVTRRQKRGILPKQATSVMRSWLFQHLCHPYPTEDEKRRIATQTNLTLLQVNNWFINARRRILQPMLDSGMVPPSSTNVLPALNSRITDSSLDKRPRLGNSDDDGDAEEDDDSFSNSNVNSEEFSDEEVVDGQQEDEEEDDVSNESAEDVE